MTKTLQNLIPFILLSIIFVTESYGLHTISGSIVLENQTVHDGVTVLLQRTAPSSLEYTTTTDIDGNYTIDVESGIYHIYFTKLGYLKQNIYNQIVYNNFKVEPVDVWEKNSRIHVPTEVDSIQKAIDYALNGDTVIVAPGIYHEELDFKGNNIKLLSQFFMNKDSNLIDNTIIDLPGINHYGITCSSGEDSTCLMGGFTLISDASISAGLYVKESNLKIRNMIFDLPKSTRSIIVSNSNCIIENIEIKSGSNAIYLIGSDLKLNNSIFINCTHSSLSITSGTVEIINCLFLNNDYDFIHNYGSSDIKIYNCTFHNTGRNAIEIEDDGTLELKNSIISNSGSGHGIILENGNHTIENCIFWNNSPDHCQGCNEWILENIIIDEKGDSIDAYNNKKINPLFVDPGNNDLHLQPASPGLDAGQNRIVNSFTDLDNKFRIIDGDKDGSSIIDIGVYEYGDQDFAVDKKYICLGETNPGFSVEGSGIEWFEDKELTNLIATGNTYIPVDHSEGIHQYYAVEEVLGLKFIKKEAILTIHNNVGPAGNIEGIQTVCQGSGNYLYAIPPAERANSYRWSVPSGVTILSADSSGIEVFYTDSAASGNINVAGYNSGCGSGPLSPDLPVNVIPLPGTAGNIICPDTTVQGETEINISIPAITDATEYYWSLPYGTEIIDGKGSNSITVNMAYDANSGMITVYGGNTCGNGEKSEKNIHVKILPEAPTTTDINICEGETIPVLNAEGINLRWYTDNNRSNLVHTGNNFTLDISVPGSYVYYVTQTIDGIESAPETLKLDIIAKPGNAGHILGESVVCQGSAHIKYEIPEINNVTYYIWNMPGEYTIISGDSTRSVYLGFDKYAESGKISVHGMNKCGSGDTSDFFPVTVNPLPGAIQPIIGDLAVCVNETGVNYHTEPLDFATEYIWAVPENIQINSGQKTSQISLNIGTNARSGFLSVFAQNQCGHSDTSQLYLSIENLPTPGDAENINGPVDICINDEHVVFDIPPILNATYYEWSLPEGALIQKGHNSREIIVDMTSSLSGEILVMGKNGCGEGGISPAHDINMITVPGPVTDIFGDNNICPESENIPFFIDEIENVSSYVWTLPDEAFLMEGSGSNQIKVNFSSEINEGIISVKGVNQCGTGDSAFVNLIVNPLPKVTCSPSYYEIFEGEEVVLTAEGASTYVWSSGSDIINTETKQITVSPFVNTQYIVTGTDDNNCIGQNTATVIVNCRECESGNILFEQSGNINHGCLYNHYYNNATCTWLIAPSGASNVFLKFLTDSFDIKPGDRISIFDGKDENAPLLGEFNNDNIPSSIIESTGNKLFLQFKSDASKTGLGFQAKYGTDQDPIDKIQNVQYSDISINPNPSNGILKVKFYNFNEKLINLYIFTSPGQLIEMKELTSIVDNPVLELDISTYQIGIYWLKVISGDRVFVKKIILE